MAQIKTFIRKLTLYWLCFHLLAMLLVPLQQFRFVKIFDPIFNPYRKVLGIQHSWSFFIFPERSGFHYIYTPANSDSVTQQIFPVPKLATHSYLYKWNHVLLGGAFRPIIDRFACEQLGGPKSVQVRYDFDSVPSGLGNDVVALRNQTIESIRATEGEYPCN